MAEGVTETITFDAAGFEAIARELAAALGQATKAFQIGLSAVFTKTGKQASGSSNPFKNMTKGVADSLKIIEARLRSLDQLAARININPATFGLINDNVEQTHHLLKMAATEANAFAVDMNRVRAVSAATKTALGGGFLDLGSLNLQFREMRSIRETDAKLQDRLLRNQADREKSAASARIVTEQGANARMIASSKAANQRRVELFRAAVQQIRALERGLGAVFRFTARQIEGAFRGLGRTISTSISGALARSNAGLTRGTSSALGRRESMFRTSFSRQEKIVNDSITRQTRTIQNFERKLSSGVIGAASGRGAAGGIFGGGLLAGAAGGLGLGALLSSGFERFSQLETLNRQFTVLTGSAENAALMMAQVKDFAKITPFDLVGVAGLAKGFLAIGTATEDVLPQVKTIADAVAFTGGGTDALERIQRAIGQVVSAGRLQGDELNQLAENLPSLNIRKLLADQLTGGDVAALVELQEAGKITSEMFVTGLMTGLSTDPRIAGAAQDMANTLKGRFDNLKESFSDLGATIIGVFADEIKTAFRVLNEVFAGISQFIKGEDLSAGMQLLRTAAEGAAIALGGLLVVKLVAEGIGLLGSALGFLLTPFGAFIAIVGLVGAAFKVLLENSPELREQLQRLGTIIGNVFQGIKDVVGGFLGTAGDALGGAGANMLQKIGDVVANVLRIINNELAPFINVTVLPALKRFGDFIKNDLYPAVVNFLGDAAYFIVGTVIPRLKEFYNFLSGTLVPFLVDKVVGAFNAVKDVVDGLDLGKVARLGGIAAALIAGFAAGGPLGGILAAGGVALALVFSDSFREAVVGDLSDIGDSIAGLLEGPLTSVGNAIRDFFSTDNLLDIAGNVLDFIETVGFTIANILTDPRVVAGVATFVGLAAAAAVRFVEGLIRGIADNLPGLYRLLKDAGGEALKALVDGMTSGDVLKVALPALLVGGAMLGAWRRAGTQAGMATGQGFLGSFKTNAFGGALAGGGTLTRGGAAGAFIGQMLFGSGGPEAAERRLATQTTKLMTRQMNILAAAGRSVPLTGGGSLAGVVGRMTDAMEKEIGAGGVRAARFKATVTAFMQGGIKAGAAQMGGFVAMGRQIGSSIAGGLAGAFAGIQVGKSIKESGGGIGDALLGIGGTALAIGAINAPAGIAAGVLGTLAYAISRVGDESKDATPEVDAFVEALGKSGEEGARALGEEVLTQLNEAFDPDTMQRLLQSGFDIGAFIQDTLLTNTTNVREVIEQLTPALEKNGLTAERIDEIYAGLQSTWVDFRNAVPAREVLDTFNAQLEEMAAKMTGADRITSKMKENIVKIHGAMVTFLTGKRTLQVAEDLKETEERLRDNERAAQDARDAVTEFLSGEYKNTLPEAIDEFVRALPTFSASIEEIILLDPGSIRTAAENAARDALQDPIAVAIREFIVDSGTAPTIENITEFINTQLKPALDSALETGDITITAHALAMAQLDGLLQSPAELQALVQKLIDGGLIPNVTVAADGTIVLREVGVSLPENFPPIQWPAEPAFPETGFSLPEGFPPMVVPADLSFGDNPNLIPGLLPFADSGAAAQTVDVPITVNPIITIGNQTALQAVGGSIANFIAQGILGAGLIVSIAAIAVVNTSIAAAGLAVGGAAVVGGTLSSNLAKGILAGGRIAVASAAIVGVQAASAFKVSSDAIYQIGLNLGGALARGIRESGQTAINAARAVANAVINIMKSTLKITSPSRVFYDIGIEAGRGFAEGMKDSEGSMVSAASEAVSAAMEAAATAAGQPQGNLIAGIFEAYQVKTGGAASISLNQGITGLVGIGQRFADQLNQMATDIWNATASGDFGSGLIGQNWNSLDIFTKAGAANQAAFVDAGNQIRDFIVTNLQAGMDPATVFAFARQYRDELINSAVGATGDPTTINALIEALGLSEGALNAFWQQVLAATAAAEEHAKTLDEAAAAEKAKEEAEKKAGEDQEKEIERLKELIRLAGINTRPIDVHVSPPFGDPEAIGLGVANRVAYSLAG